MSTVDKLTISVTDSQGNVGSATFDLPVYSAPSITLAGPTGASAGQAVQVTGTVSVDSDLTVASVTATLNGAALEASAVAVTGDAVTVSFTA